MMGFPDKLDPFKFLKMEQCIKENGLYNQIKRMVEEFKYGQMVQDMMVFGDKEWQTDMEDLSMPKEMCMRVNGLRIKQMDLVFILISMEADMRVTGSKISSMVLV
jgi:hypothetical protein